MQGPPQAEEALRGRFELPRREPPPALKAGALARLGYLSAQMRRDRHKIKGAVGEGLKWDAAPSTDGDTMQAGPVVAVVGGGAVDEETYAKAREVGRLLAEGGAVVLNGGYGGVMEAASEGAASAGGLVIGVLQGTDRMEGNPHLSVGIATGMGRGRNTIIAITCDAMVAVDGGYGTLSEVAQALNHGRPVVALGSWELPEAGEVDPDLFHSVGTPEEVARLALELACRRHCW